MVKILFTSDWQIAVGNLDRAQVMLRNLLRVVEEEAPKYVVHAGDLKEAFNPVDQRVTNFLVHSVSAIRARGAELLILLGNHDRINTQEDSDTCFPALRQAGAHTIDTPTAIAMGRESAAAVTFFAVPFSRDNAKVAAAIKEFAAVKTSGHRVLLFHADISECAYGPARANTSGAGVPLKALMAKRFDLCIGGHIHYQQQLSENVWYVGSPFAMDWGEANQKKGHLLAELGNGAPRVSHVAGGLPGWYDPLLPGMPKKVNWKGTTVRLRVDCSAKDPRADIAKAEAAAAVQYPGARLHIVPEFGRNAQIQEHLVLEGTDKAVLSEYLSSLQPQMKRAGIKKQEVLEYILQRLPPGAAGLHGLRLHRVEAENVLCYESVTLDLTQPGLTMVTGVNQDWGGHSNGSGKSTLLSLPLLALFGCTPKGQSHDNWKRKGAKQARLALTFVLPDGRQCQLTRTRPAGVRLCVAKQDMTMGKVGDTQQTIEQVTGLTWDVLVNSIYLGQPDASTLLRGTPKERKELFSRFLGLDRFLQTQELIRQEANQVKASIAGKSSDIQAAEARVAEVDLTIKDFKLPERVTQEAIDQASAALEAATDTYADANDKYTKARANSEKLHQDLRPVMEAVIKASNAFDTALRQLREFTTKSKNGSKVCPTCGQPVGETFSHRYLKTLKSQEEKTKQAFEVQRAELSKHDEHVKAARAKEDAARASMRRAQDSLQQCKDVLRELKTARKLYMHAKGQRAELVERRATYRKNKELLEQQLAELEQRASFLSFCAMVSGRDGVPAYLCARAAPALNSAAARYSEAFSDGEIQVRFRLDQGDLDVDVLNAHGGERVEDQSTGEARMASLVSLFAMRDVLVPMGILILDEPGEGLDAMNAQAFAKGLSQVVARFGSVYLTTHNPHILGAVEADRYIEVVKENGVARAAERG